MPFFFFSISITIFGIYALLMTLGNNIFFYVSRRRTRRREGPLISVLIPARNEALRIGPTLAGLLDQDYRNFEVLILDDNSEDDTWTVLENFAGRNDRIKCFKGRLLPEGWKGKPYAMSQLADEAQGEILVFLDADMKPERDFLSWVADRMETHGVDSLSAYPRHRARSVLEYAACSLVYLVNMIFLPFWLIKKTRASLISHAIGQLMVFRKDAYWSAGGFASVRDKILEDIQMGRHMKSQGFRHVFLDARKVLSGYMFDSWGHTVSGLERTIYEYFDKKTYPIIIMTVFLFAVGVVPVFLLIPAFLGSWFGAGFLVLGVLLVFLSWALTLWDRRLPWYTPFFYPLQIGFLLILAWVSVADERSGRGYLWKGRKVL